MFEVVTVARNMFVPAASLPISAVRSADFTVRPPFLEGFGSMLLPRSVQPIEPDAKNAHWSFAGKRLEPS